MQTTFLLRLSPVFAVLCASLPLRQASAVDFEKEILPILTETCLDCHGPDKQRSEFRVDQRAIMLKGGDSGIAALVPGDPAGSYLIEVINGSDPDMIMPPKGDPLTKEQVALVEKWIAEGAEWPGQMDAEHHLTTDLWSFQPVVRPVVRPEVPGDAAKPVDAFLAARLKEAGIAPNGPADPRSLIRRVSVVLTGLPPTPDRVESFIKESSVDADSAYERLVEELLASEHFGERWAQHWLDVIRWAETNGSEANLYRKNAWIYRDYVIRAFNEDVPYDRFVTEQLAGDQLGVGEATGFLVAGPHVPAATVGREPSAIRQARADRMDEIIQTVGASVLGVTVGCARCHNHKFDPISIQDYYSLTAIFQGVEFGGRYPEFSEDHPRQQRARELRAEMSRVRSALREGAGQWEEDWGGFTEMQFPATRTAVLRIEFDRPAVFIDELQVYGPADYNANLALASVGTKLVEDPEMADAGSLVGRANDGEFGTMVWKSRAPKDSKEKPWVEVHFAETQEVNRFRFSNNREYYFETDYLEKKGGGGFPGYRISAQQSDGSFKEVGKTASARELLKQKPGMKQAAVRLHELIARISEEGPRHSFVGRFEKPVVTHVLHRGSPENPRDEVMPAGFEILEGDLGLDSASPESERRLRFAKWLVRPEHPLTSRVIVNRIWLHLFGTGIVPTAADFGAAGAPPTHPELLDWLASEFVRPTVTESAPWSMKSMIRLLVMSDAFRRSSLPSEAGLNADAGAALLWRYPPQRVEAEVIRDGILQASGKLDPSLGGRSFRIHNEKKTYAQWEVVNNHGPETWRRMIYQERMRRVDDRMFTAFDFPDCGQVRATRPVSTTPLQALNLMNSDFVVEQSNFIAERAQKEAGDDKEAQVRRVFQLLLTRGPDADELAACLPVDLSLVCRSLINSNEYAFLP
ncbi:MAG: PSD1 domain-containing protein [Verrucomicrobiae bacterium]|nr:PSD1 domain-containing protein [Verrucomicrobiae bacterium]